MNKDLQRLLWALGLGCVLGLVAYGSTWSQTWVEVTGWVNVAFLRAIKMIVGPLVLCTVAVGVARMGSSSSQGSLGTLTWKIMLWFISAGALSLALGGALANVLQPGQNLGLPLPTAAGAPELKTMDVVGFIKHLVPASLFDALAQNEILQVLFFAILLGVTLMKSPQVGRPVFAFMESMAELLLQMTGLVMKVAPVVVFAAVSGLLAKNGVGALQSYAIFAGGFTAGLVLLWALLIGVGALFLGQRLWPLLKDLRDPMLLAFSTASSEAAFPKMLAALDKNRIPRDQASYALSLGYSFNLDGSMLYCSYAALFIAQAYGVHLDWSTQLFLFLFLMLTSKGIAGVPKASLVVIAAALGQVGVPAEGIALLLAVDHFLDMARSATNALGNGLATASCAVLDTHPPKANTHTQGDQNG